MWYPKQPLTSDTILSAILIGLLLSLALVTNFFIRTSQQFSYLASAFLHGQLFFLGTPGGFTDTVFYHGHLYWASGFLPPLLMMPGVALGQMLGFFFLQGYLQFFVTISILVIIARLSRRLGFSKSDARYLAFAFVAASTMLLNVLFPLSWYFAQVLTVFFLFMALDEFYSSRRPWVIGSLMALAMMTRLTAGFGIIFFLLSELFPQNNSVVPKAQRTKN